MLYLGRVEVRTGLKEWMDKIIKRMILLNMKELRYNKLNFHFHIKAFTQLKYACTLFALKSVDWALNIILFYEMCKKILMLNYHQV